MQQLIVRCFWMTLRGWSRAELADADHSQLTLIDRLFSWKKAAQHHRITLPYALQT